MILGQICELFIKAKLYREDKLIASNTTAIQESLVTISPDNYQIRNGIVFLFREHPSGGQELLPYSLELVNQDGTI